MQTVVASAADRNGSNHDLVAALSRHLPDGVILVAGETERDRVALSSAEVTIVLIRQEDQVMTTAHGMGWVLSQIGQVREAAIIPVLVDSASMPTRLELPESLRWFPFLNAVGVSTENIELGATRIANAVKNRATLTEPPSPVDLWWAALRHGFRSMCWGPAWAFAAMSCLIAALALFRVVAPSTQTEYQRLGAAVIFLAALTWAIWGGFLGRRLKGWGIVVSAAAGPVLLGVPIVMAATILCAGLLIFDDFESKLSWSNKIVATTALGTPLFTIGMCLILGWIAQARYAPEGTRSIKPSHWLRIGIGALTGVVLGLTAWLVSNQSDKWRAIALLVLYFGASGVLMGLLRGMCDAICLRRIGALQTSSRPLSVEKPTESEGESCQNLQSPAALRVSSRRPPQNIFLSYRRADSAAAARQIHDELASRVKGFHVFRDVDAIPYGLNFRDVIEDEVARCDVFVAIVASQWLDIKNGEGNRRLDDHDDFVRIEIELALGRGVPVIVALIDNARRLTSSELPESIIALADCRQVSLTKSGAIEPLCTEVLNSPPAPRRKLAMRERLDLAVHTAAQGAVVWAIIGLVAGTTIGLVQTFWDFTPTVAYAVGLLILPAVGGLWVGRSFGGWGMSFAGMLAMPFTVFCLTLLVWLGTALPYVVGAGIGANSTGHVQTWHFVLGALVFLGTTISSLAGLRVVLRHRARRIRVWKAALRVVGSMMLGAALAVAIGYFILRVIPPTDWPRVYAVLFVVCIFMISSATIAVVNGTIRGYLTRMR